MRKHPGSWFDKQPVLDAIERRKRAEGWERDLDIEVALGFHPTAIRALRNRPGPIRAATADRWAIRLGLHPAILWPDWELPYVETTVKPRRGGRRQRVRIWRSSGINP